MTDFRLLPDLARRDVGGAVVAANDEAFASRENLITPGPSVFDPSTFGPKGKVYDGWETRRRREPGHDDAIVRLGAPGIVRGVVVDTSWFTGNYPPEIAVDGLAADPHTPVTDLVAADGWVSLVERSAVKGDTENPFDVDCDARITHVRLRIFPDGGVARLRVHGQARPDPALLDALGTVDLAAVENGGRVTGCSNLFYSSPQNLLLPGPARSMGEGWETARRRGDGNDWVEVALAAQAQIAVAELDTSWFLHNAPGSASLRGRDGDGEWHDLLARTALGPDTRHPEHREHVREQPVVADERHEVEDRGRTQHLIRFGVQRVGQVTRGQQGRRGAGDDVLGRVVERRGPGAQRCELGVGEARAPAERAVRGPLVGAVAVGGDEQRRDLAGPVGQGRAEPQGGAQALQRLTDRRAEQHRGKRSAQPSLVVDGRMCRAPARATDDGVVELSLPRVELVGMQRPQALSQSVHASPSAAGTPTVRPAYRGPAPPPGRRRPAGPSR